MRMGLNHQDAKMDWSKVTQISGKRGKRKYTPSRQISTGRLFVKKRTCENEDLFVARCRNLVQFVGAVTAGRTAQPIKKAKCKI